MGLPRLSMFHWSTTNGTGAGLNTDGVVTYKGAPPATMYTAPVPVSNTVPSAGTGFRASNCCWVMPVYGCAPPTSLQSFTYRAAPPAISQYVVVPETCTNVPFGKASD